MTTLCWNQHTRELISARKTSHKHKRPESPTVTLTWHACKYKVHTFHQRYMHFFFFYIGLVFIILILGPDQQQIIAHQMLFPKRSSFCFRFVVLSFFLSFFFLCFSQNVLVFVFVLLFFISFFLSFYYAFHKTI